MSSRGSVVVGVVIAVLATATAVETAALAVQARRADRAQAAAEQLCADRVAEVQAQVATCSGDLGECRARVTAESIGAALAPGLTDAQARADILRGLPRARLTEAVIATGSPRMVAAETWMARCESLQVLRETDRLGCGSGNQAITAYISALETMAACPACPECPAPSEGQAPE